MKLAAMQPYFLPYLGQFDLLNQADIWIAADTVQYIRHGWVNRNRVLHPVAGWQYITVPVRKHPHTTPIYQIEIATQVAWQSRLFKQMEHYHRDAPYYSQVIALLQTGLQDTPNNLARLNVHLFRSVGRYLGIQTPIHVFSEMGLTIKPLKGPEALALSICLELDADEYINSPGGLHLYNPARFSEQGLRLTIQDFSPMIYACGPYTFQPNLSIVDVMMWNSPETIKYYLDTTPWRENPQTGTNQMPTFNRSNP